MNRGDRREAIFIDDEDRSGVRSAYIKRGSGALGAPDPRGGAEQYEYVVLTLPGPLCPPPIPHALRGEPTQRGVRSVECGVPPRLRPR